MGELVRIAQVLNRMDSGGIEAVVMNYYRNIDKKRVQFDFYFAQDSEFPQREELERLGAGIYPVPSYSNVLQYHKALYKAFSERKYKIVHVHLSTMSVFPLFVAWRAGVRVRICHNHSTAHWGEGKRSLLKYILRPFNKVFATDYFACGEQAGRWMYGRQAFESGRVTVLPNAIDVKNFAYDDQFRIRMRKELYIANDTFVVGHVGRFVYQKNHEFLIRVFERFTKIHPQAVLLLIGEGELENNVRKMVEYAGIQDKVIFMGVRSDVNKLYSVMDAFCLPSHYEGMPVVAWEAQANGLPCVLSDAISTEAICDRNSVQISLNADVGDWCEALYGRSRKAASKVPDIRSEAKKLMQIYLKMANEVAR